MKSLDDTLTSLSESQRHLLNQWLTAMEPQQSSPSGRKQIRALVVAEDPQANVSLLADQIKPFLASRLPQYMVPDRIDFVDSLPRLPNGKLDRTAVRRRIEQNSVSVNNATDHFVEPRNLTESILAEIWSESLQIEPIGISDNFFELGGDSIISIQIVSKARDRGLNLNHSHFQHKPTIAEMAANLHEATPALSTPAEPERRHGTGGLTPIQHWFVQRNLSKPNHWNSARSYELKPGLTDTSIRAAVQACLDHHEGLRARFPQASADGIRCQMDIPQSGSEVFQTLPASATPEEVAHFVTAAQARFSLADGPLIAVAYVPDSQAKPGRLVVIAHHLLLDNLSWNILSEDLATALSAVRHSSTITLPPRTTSLIDWSQFVADLANSDQCQASLAYWQTTEVPGDIPVDVSLTNWPTEKSVKSIQSTLGKAISDRLSGNAMKAYNIQVRDLLIAALALTLSEWTHQTAVQFDLEGHGRDSFDSHHDVSRTVGWFTSFFPHALAIPPGSGAETVIKTTKESLRQLPGNGNYFGLLRYLSSSQEIQRSLESVQKSQVLFNYLGRSPSPAPASEAKPLNFDQVALRAPDNARSHLLEINTEMTDNGLVSTWLYSDDVHRPETIERLVTRYSEHLAALIDHCESSEAGGFTVSDFPDAALDQDDLDNLFDSFAPDQDS